MRLCKALLLLLVIGIGAGCSGGGGSNGSPPPRNNVVRVTVDGDLCSAGSYLNKPCVQVTVCTPGTSNCQTISDILLDTGSYGLRIFQNASAGQPLLTVPLFQVRYPSGSDLAECAAFGGGALTWGPVQTADVYLGNELASGVPIQVIDATFYSSRQSSVCANPERYPSDAGAGFNGILGIGPLIYDYGPYYSCDNTTGNCSTQTPPFNNMVQNPVALLPNDNNGVVVQLPAVGPGGQPSADGSLLLGVGTRANNTPSGVTTYGLDQDGNFITIFNGTRYSDSFTDTGSNGLFFPGSSSLPPCPYPASGWFCPGSPSLISLSPTIEGASGSPTGQVSFEIGNILILLSSNRSSRVFPDIGGNYPTFDWGLPFYLGRSVYIGMSGANTPIGAGPYIAY
jgi:hypothetical protein